MSDIVERLGKCVAVSEMIGDNPVVMKDAIDEITRLRAENETLRRDVKTAVMGDSAELQDVKRENEKLEQQVAEFVNRFTEDMFVLRAENEKLREALLAERERCARITERYLSNNEPVRLTVSSIAAAIRESGE